MRNRFHSICPYFAIFPESFVREHLDATDLGGVVFDPFCGRGTAVFEALLRGRKAAGCDIHPVAVCVTKAKCNIPESDKILSRIEQLRSSYSYTPADKLTPEMKEFFANCYSRKTYAQLRFLRANLDWKNSDADCFISALCLASLHGESHRSKRVFSNRMPRTISTKPAYSVRWWRKMGYVAEYRNVFEILNSWVEYRYKSDSPARSAKVVASDARRASREFSRLRGKVTDVITSPPYLDTTNYREDQWLRLWFLGEDATSRQRHMDGRHLSKDRYWKFLDEAWEGVAPLLAPKARVAIRIGGRKMSKKEVLDGLSSGLARATNRKVSKIRNVKSSTIQRTQANSFRGAKVDRAKEHDFCFMVE